MRRAHIHGEAAAFYRAVSRQRPAADPLLQASPRHFASSVDDLSERLKCGLAVGRYQPYGTEESTQTYTIKYDLSQPGMSVAQKRIMAWRDQWKTHGLGDYGGGVPCAEHDADGMFRPRAAL